MDPTNCVLALVVLIPFNVIIVYVLGIYTDTVEPIFPYISDCATQPPQASFFTLMMSISAILFVFIGLLRYFQTNAVIESEMFCNLLRLSSNDKKRIKYWNSVSRIAGLLIVMSCLSTGSFRVNEAIPFHGLSAGVLFLSIVFMFLVQTWISFQLQPYINSKLVANSRLIVTFLSLLSLIVYAIFIFWSYILFKRDFRKNRYKWKADDGGYIQHLISTSAEWVLIFMICPFLYSYVPEFRRIKFIEIMKLEVIPAVVPKTN